MARTIATDTVTAISLRAARVSLAAAAAYVVLLAMLHVIKPEFDPSWPMASEYAIGDYGWVMRIAFFSMALSCVAVFAVLRFQIETIGGRIGLYLLVFVTAALVIGGIFVVDPVTIKEPEEMTTHGMLHSVARANRSSEKPGRKDVKSGAGRGAGHPKHAANRSRCADSVAPRG
jgi:hypothetical protein